MFQDMFLGATGFKPLALDIRMPTIAVRLRHLRSLEVSIYGLLVTKGVDEPKRPSFETDHYSRERERE